MQSKIVRVSLNLPRAMFQRLLAYLERPETAATGMTDRTELIRTALDYYLTTKGA